MKDFMIGALLGGTAGAAAALLLTPMSGTKMRETVMTVTTHRKKSPNRRTLAKKRQNG